MLITPFAFRPTGTYVPPKFMFRIILLAFTVIPIVEAWLLFEVGDRIGFLNTVALVIFTGVVGAFLAKQEGLRVLREWQGALGRGEMPKEGIASGLLLLVSGVLLITPGVLTDAFGLSLLLPPIRGVIATALTKYAGQNTTMSMGHVGFHQQRSYPPSSRPPAAGGVIEADGEEVSREVH